MIKAIIFDLDGTLTNTLPSVAAFGTIALKAAGFPEIPEEPYRYFLGNGRDKLIHRMLAYLDADTPENFKRVGERYDLEYAKNPTYLTKPYDGIMETLAALKKQGVKMAVLSNKPDDMTHEVVENFFPGMFDLYFGMRKGIPGKPAPDAALMIVKEFGVSPAECLFVGDTSVDAETGKNAGIFVLGALWGFRGEKDLQQAGARIAHPREILSFLKN